MQTLRSAIIAAMVAASPLAFPTSPAWAQACTCGGVGIRAEEAPPPLPEYDQPPMPAPGYIWTPGYWSYNNVDYYWVPGTWVEPPRPGLLWTPGYWALAGGVYVFNAGYWGPHVGFYGGIPYGFGYGGSGYQGGRWDNGQFYYNRSVNNIGNVHVTNVYEEKVTINNVTNRVSFNGEGGIVARPTAEEELAAHEQHEKLTRQQLDHNRAASISAGAFASTNHGKPDVAATVRPAALTGSGVVRAKSAGAMAPLTPAGAEAPKTDIAPEKEKAKAKAPEKVDHKNEMKPEPKPEVEKPKEEKAPVEKTQQREKTPERDQHRESDQHKEKTAPEKPREEPKAAAPEKPREEQRPAPEKAHEEPKMRPAPTERKPEGPRPGPQERNCGHPGEPACH